MLGLGFTRNKCFPPTLVRRVALQQQTMTHVRLRRELKPLRLWLTQPQIEAQYA